MKKLLIPIIVSIVLSSANTSQAQSDATMWIYYGTGTTINPIIPGGSSQIMQNPYYVEIGGTDMSDSQYIRWTKLYTGDFIYGSNSGNKVRALDLIEDYDINWTTSDVLASPSVTPTRWISAEQGHLTFEIAYRSTLNVGPHPNELFFENDNIIAMMDDNAVFLDDDGSVSYYYLGGSLTNNPTWTTLSGGLLDGLALTSVLGSQFIGAEELQMAFLVGPDRVQFYSILTGSLWAEADYSLVNTGPLAGAVTLEEIINGQLLGWSFIGIDGAGSPGPVIIDIANVPEPSSVLLLGTAGLLALHQLRRRMR